MTGKAVLCLLCVCAAGTASINAAPISRFALLAAGGADRSRDAYLRVLESVELPCAKIAADAPEEVLRDFPALIVPASTARALGAAGVQRIVNAARRGTLVMTEEDTPLSRALGLSFAPEKVEVSQVEDLLYPHVSIVWQKSAMVSSAVLPPGARLLEKEKWSGAPLMFTFPLGRGRVLFLAAELDPQHGDGYARFPYLIHALVKECGVQPLFRSPRLHAFFDYGYRTSVDLEYFARRWRKSGVEVLHVSAWQFYDRTYDDYLKELIAACHKQGILIYAWFELPHVTDRFWQEHPEWREKTAALVDARMDWRALINLLHPAAFQAVSQGMRSLLAEFDWDGINLGELYFESLEGPENQQRFTPMNDQVRAEFSSQIGWDPVELFQRESPHFWKKDPDSWKKFVEYRAGLVERLHEKVLGVAGESRRSKPYLDVAVTFVDNVYDPRMKEATGSDVYRILPLAARFPFTLILEDPATIWSLGPTRYRVLGERYGVLLPGGRLGIDVNVVERYQDVYPTKKQTGVEFLQIFHHAAAHFPTVLVYAENSVYPQDMELVAYALADGARVVEESAGRMQVESPRPVMVRAGDDGGGGEIFVDGSEWPAREGDEILLPAGKHVMETRSGPAGPRLHRLTGELLESAYDGPRALRFRYRSQPRAAAVFSSCPARLLVDGAPYAIPADRLPGECSVLLPPGEHEIRVEF